jgi:leucyl aminopeptidase
MTEFNFASGATAPYDVHVFAVPEGEEPHHSFAVAFAKEKFTGKAGEILVAGYGDAHHKTVFLGLGDPAKLNAATIRGFAGPVLKAAATQEHLLLNLHNLPDNNQSELAAQLADALLTETYAFRRYKTAPEKKPALHPATITLLTANPGETASIFRPLQKVTESVFWASDLVNEPGNELNPKTYGTRIFDELAPLGVRVDYIEELQMQELGMGAALAVGRGSEIPPRMVVMRYNGAPEQERPVALVGKGITFDSGGISLKPGADMHEMTMDMGGSAAVAGAVRALAARRARVNIAAIVPLAENMPDGRACRPGDVVKTMSGKTVEILNTDAEGRLVLADALTYIQQLKPRAVIDLATLTGAAVGALGPNIAAAYANDNSLFNKFNAASKATGEKIWRMPLDPEFAEAMRRSDKADLINLGGRYGGSCTAAAFLREFIEKAKNGRDKYPWIHIDMAGPGIPHTALKGWGVRLLERVVRDHFEDTEKRRAQAKLRT